MKNKTNNSTNNSINQVQTVSGSELIITDNFNWKNFINKINNKIKTTFIKIKEKVK